MRQFLFAITTALALAATALAETAPEGGAPAAASPKVLGEQLLASIKEFDPALLGTQQFGFYLQGATNIGNVTLNVEKAPEGATYRVRTKIAMAMGPMKQQQEEDVLLDTQLALVSMTSTSLEESPEGKKKEVETRNLENGKWLATTTTGEGDEASSTTVEVDDEGAIHSEMASVLLLATRLDLSKPGSYLLKGANWSPDDEETEAGYEPMNINVAAAAPYEHRGEMVDATLVHFGPIDGSMIITAVSPEHGVLAFWPEGPPLKFIAGTGEEVTEDIAATGPAVEGGPKEAVVVYLNVLAGALEADALDSVMDWDAIHAEMAEETPDVKDLTVEAITRRLKEGFAGAAAISTEQVEVLKAMLEVAVTEDSATVTMPGKEEDPFYLRKAGETWLITHFPH